MVDGFDPVASKDYASELVTSYKDINAGMDNYWNQEIDNYNYAASFAGDNLKALADLSQTWSGVLKEKEEKQKEVDFAKGHMWFFENGVPADAQLAYDNATADLYAEGEVINDMRSEWENEVEIYGLQLNLRN